MKILIIFTLFTSFSAFSRPVDDFNKALLQDVKTDVQKNEDRFKQERNRGPASVQENPERKIEEPQKIDKNIRQIGPNRW